MKKFNPWAFGMLFLLCFVYFSISETDWSFLFLREKVKTKAYIVDTKVGYGMRGYGYMQYVYYIYVAKNKVYIENVKIGKNYEWQHIGNTIEIEYSKSYPEKNKIIKFNNDHNNSKYEVFNLFHNKSYEKIFLIKNIFLYREYNFKNHLIKEVKEFYEIIEDTIIVSQFLEKKNYKFLKRDNKLKDMESLKVFKLSEL